MKKSLIISVLTLLFVNITFADRSEFKNLTREEKEAKRKERYDNATPEQKAKMDERKKKREALAKELGFDLTTKEGRKAFHKYKKLNRSKDDSEKK